MKRELYGLLAAYTFLLGCILFIIDGGLYIAENVNAFFSKP